MYTCSGVAGGWEIPSAFGGVVKVTLIPFATTAVSKENHDGVIGRVSFNILALKSTEFPSASAA